MKKITLVELPATSFGRLNAHRVKDVYTGFFLPARANPQLHAILLQAGYTDVKSIDPLLNKGHILTKEDLERINQSDYLLLSSITRTIFQTRELALLCKKNNPSVTIIVGGPHATFAPKSILEWADVVVRGEGDKTIIELLDKLEKKESLKTVKGISFNSGGNVINNPDREFLTEKELSALPFPEYSLYPAKTVGVVSTSRGCPYACNFCSVTKLYGYRYRRKSNEHILKEIDSTLKHFKDIFFTDDNFAAKKSETKELLRTLIDHRTKGTGYSCQLSINSAFTSFQNNEIDTEFIGLLKTLGVFTVYLGIESVNEETLKSFNKPATVERNKLAVKAFREGGLWVHGMMIIGGDGDTEQSLKETLSWAEQNLDSVQFLVPIPFPGTQFTEEMEKQERVFTKNYFLYDGIHVLIKPKNFSPYQLQLKLMDMHKKFYSFKNNPYIKNSKYPWKKRLVHAYARKILWDIEHEPQTRVHLQKLKLLKNNSSGSS